MSHRARELASRALVAAATAAALLAVVTGYARQAAFDSDQFANRATSALRDESVRSLVAERITDEVVLEAEDDLIAARPIIESAASAIVGGRAFTSLFGAAVRDVHRTLFEGDANTLTLTVADAGTLLSVALQQLRPSLARDVERTGPVALIRRDAGSLGASAARLAEQVRGLALILLALAIVLVAGALAASTDRRRRTVVQLGIGAAGAGVLLIVAYGCSARSRSMRSRAPRSKPLPPSGMPSWPTCEQRRGSWPARAPSSRPRPVRSSGPSTWASPCGVRPAGWPPSRGIQPCARCAARGWWRSASWCCWIVTRSSISWPRCSGSASSTWASSRCSGSCTGLPPRATSALANVSTAGGPWPA